MNLERPVQWIIKAYFTLTILLAIPLAVCSFLTRVVFRQRVENDLFDFLPENIPLLLACSVLFLAIAAVYVKKTEEGAGASSGRVTDTGYLKTDLLFRILMVYALGVSLFIIFSVRGLATNDARMLNDIINAFMQGDYSSMGQYGYLSIYPFQISYVMIGQLLYILFGPDNFLVYQLINVVCILLTMWLLYEITWEMFGNERICGIMSLLGFGAMFFYVYSTYVYNDIWSFLPQTAAFWLEIRYLKKPKALTAVLAAVCIALAILLKSNCYIALIAMAAMLVFSPIRNREGGRALVRNLVIALLMFVLSSALSAGVMQVYVNKAGLPKAPDGVPAMAYFAMGMQEMEGKYGWYDGYNAGIYTQNECDGAKASEAAKEEIRERIRFFGGNRKYFVKFYLGKYLSQWADDTFISLRELELTGRHVENQPKTADWLIFGTGYHIMDGIMNVFHFLVLLGTLIYGGRKIFRDKLSGISDAEALVIMFIFGGMLFHQLWEASSRYVMRYFLFLLPAAAFGIYTAARKLAEYGKHVRSTDS